MPRDFSVAYTEDELEGLKALFRTLPTFSDEGYILSTDIGGFVEKMEYERTPDQIAIIKAQFDKHYGGIVPLSKVLNKCRTLHDTSKATVTMLKDYDKESTGSFALADLEEVLATLITFDPKLNGISAEDFFKGAEGNATGRVNIEEFSKWIAAYLRNV